MQSPDIHRDQGRLWPVPLVAGASEWPQCHTWPHSQQRGCRVIPDRWGERLLTVEDAQSQGRRLGMLSGCSPMLAPWAREKERPAASRSAIENLNRTSRCTLQQGDVRAGWCDHSKKEKLAAILERKEHTGSAVMSKITPL